MGVKKLLIVVDANTPVETAEDLSRSLAEPTGSSGPVASESVAVARFVANIVTVTSRLTVFEAFSTVAVAATTPGTEPLMDSIRILTTPGSEVTALNCMLLA